MPYKNPIDRLNNDRKRRERSRANGYYSKRDFNTKLDVLTHYGNGKCVCIKCGFDDIRALSIDHVNSNGAEHRASNNLVGSHFYHWLKRNNFPNGYQSLCMNCQFIKRHEKKEVWNQSPKTLDDRPRLL